MIVRKKAKIKSSTGSKKKKVSPLSKLSNKPKSKASPAVSGKASGWLTTGRENIREDIEHQKKMAQRTRAPEFYLKDGESKTIRFVNSDPLGKILQYVIKVNGKWRRYTAPSMNPQTGMMEPDLFEANGFNASSKVIYEVIDRTGYVNKEGKRIKNIVRFWVVGARLFEHIETIRNKYGDLRALDIEVTRSGAGTDTTYALLPEPPAPFSFGKIESIADRLEDCYAPPSLEEQKAVISQVRPNASLEDDD